jgi:hypothetical protein
MSEFSDYEIEAGEIEALDFNNNDNDIRARSKHGVPNSASFVAVGEPKRPIITSNDTSSNSSSSSSEYTENYSEHKNTDIYLKSRDRVELNYDEMKELTYPKGLPFDGAESDRSNYMAADDWYFNRPAPPIHSPPPVPVPDSSRTIHQYNPTMDLASGSNSNIVLEAQFPTVQIGRKKEKKRKK